MKAETTALQVLPPPPTRPDLLPVAAAFCFTPPPSNDLPLMVFVDGGVVGRECPSPIGATWAYRSVAVGGGAARVVRQVCGAVPADQFTVNEMTGCFEASNNQSELLAALNALAGLRAGRRFTLWSDSTNALQRLARGAASNLPDWMEARLARQVERLQGEIDLMHMVQVKGHPSQKALAAGVDRRGRTVSPHNDWCDLACLYASRQFTLAGNRAVRLEDAAIPAGRQELRGAIEIANGQLDGLLPPLAEGIAA